MSGGSSRLVRREARGDLPLLAVLALLVGVLTALAQLGPAVIARQEDHALGRRIADAQARSPLLTVSTTQIVGDPADPNAPRPVPMATVLASGRDLVRVLGGPTARELSVAGGGFVFDTGTVESPRPPDPKLAESKLTLSHIAYPERDLRFGSGHAPADATPAGTPPQIALSRATAQALGVRTGSRLSLRFIGVDGTTPVAPAPVVTVSGVFEALPTRDGFWDGHSGLADPSRYPEPNRAGTVLDAQALLGVDGADALTRAGVPGPLVTWQLRADLGPATVAGANALAGPLSSWNADLNTALCQGVDPQGNQSCSLRTQTTGAFLVSDGLSPLLRAFTGEADQARAVSRFAITSLAAVALATACVAVRLLLRRREPESRLQRARGASATRLVLLRSALAWPVVLLGALLGRTVGDALAPTGTSAAPQSGTVLGVVGTALLLVPMLTWHAVREPRTAAAARRAADRASRGGRRSRGGGSGAGGSGGDRAGGGTGGRRAALELAVLAAAAAGVVALRAQGPTPGLSAVPVLVALATVLVLLRLYPPVLRLLARRLGRGRGLLAFVGLARAARDASATGLALFVLVLTLGTAVFGGLVQRTVADGAVAGAAWTTGADAVALTNGNSTSRTAGAYGGRVRSAVVQLHTLTLVGQQDGAGIGSVAVLSVDPRRLAAVAPESSALARALLSALSTAPRTLADGTLQLPFAATPALRAREPGGGFSAAFQAYDKSPVHLGFTPTLTLTAAELDDPLLGPISEQITPGTPLLITSAAVDGLLPQESSGATAVLLRDTGPPGTAAGPGTPTGPGPATGPAAPSATLLRAAGAAALGPLAQVRVRSEALAALRADELTRGVGAVYTVSTALAVLFGLLAVALELVLSSAERGRTTSYLRTLGLGSRAAAALHLLQLVPLALAAAVGGVLLGLVEPRLLGDALNLRQFTGGPVQPALRTDYRLTLALGAGLALLVLGAAVAETALARARRLGAVLRLGQN